MKLRLTLFSLLLSSFLFIGCDDDDENNKINYFTFDGKDYNLLEGSSEIFNEGASSSDSFEFAVGLVGRGLEVTSVNYVFITMHSSDGSSLATGEYDLSNDAKPFAITDVEIAVEDNFVSSLYTSDEIVRASAKVENQGSGKYVIDFDLEFADNVNVTGNFTGSL